VDVGNLVRRFHASEVRTGWPWFFDAVSGALLARAKGYSFNLDAKMGDAQKICWPVETTDRYLIATRDGQSILGRCVVVGANPQFLAIMGTKNDRRIIVFVWSGFTRVWSRS
jgi:hypothetical protein